jgi:hypothetical protein
VFGLKNNRNTKRMSAVPVFNGEKGEKKKAFRIRKAFLSI